MRIIRISSDNLTNIYKNIVDIYIREDVNIIFGQEYNNIISIVRDSINNLIASKIVNIVYKVIIYNIVELVRDSNKLNVFLKLMHEVKNISNIITIDRRIFEEITDDLNLSMEEKEMVIANLTSIVLKYIDYLLVFEYKGSENSFISITENIINIYRDFYEQLYNEYELNNFRIELLTITNILLIV